MKLFMPYGSIRDLEFEVMISNDIALRTRNLTPHPDPTHLLHPAKPGPRNLRLSRAAYPAYQRASKHLISVFLTNTKARERRRVEDERTS